MDLTNLNDVKAWLGISSLTDDALLTRLITAESQAVQIWIGKDLASQEYTEVRSGHGGFVMTLSNQPVTDVHSVMVSEVGILPASDSLQPGFRFTERELILQGYTFGRGYGNVTVVYTAGYAAAPVDLAQACIELVSLRYKERDRIGHVSKTLAGETVAFWVKALPDSVRDVLQRYRKVVPV